MKTRTSLLWSMAMFLGWTLSFPLNGPVLNALASFKRIDPAISGLIFNLSLALSLFGCVFLPQRDKVWKVLILNGNLLCLILSLMIWLSVKVYIPIYLVLLGVSVALFIMGWVYAYTINITFSERLKRRYYNY